MYTHSRITLLGGLRIEQADRVITRFRTQKTAALLAYLAYYRKRSHAREELIELLWPESDLTSGRNGLSIALSSLRHQLEPPGVPHGAILRADRYSIQLNPDAVSTDTAELEAALQKAGQAGSVGERRLYLADTVELYGGELLPGHCDDWCLRERERLAGAYLEALHRLVELLEQAGDLDRALGYARRAVIADPLWEEGHQDVMRLLAAAGQPTAALRQYRELERRLEEQLGEQPSAAIRQHAREIEHQASGYRAIDRPMPGAAPSHASALPSRLPTGTVTFLLTDIEGGGGGTRGAGPLWREGRTPAVPPLGPVAGREPWAGPRAARWERQGEVFAAALASHHTLLHSTFHRFGGYEVDEGEDGFLVAFERAGEALACAVASQQALTQHPWPQEVDPLRVRIALHTGDVELQEGNYHGLVLHHASRMLAAAHGGQILCSEATAVLVQRHLEPGIRLSDLGVYRLRDVETPERLFQVEHPDMAQRVFPPLRAEASYARSLPPQFTRFIGRERELGQLQELLLAEPTRLVTLTGPGGSGKSRLALEVARHLGEAFNGGAPPQSGGPWFVPLAALSDPRRIVDAVREALRLPRSPAMEPLDQVVEMLSRQSGYPRSGCVLVLDNFEQLVVEGAAVVQTLLERVPLLKCVVTSRQRLDLSGEREFVVPPLQTPAGTDTPEQLSMYESVQLFIDRAQAARPDFQVTNRNAAAVAELCTRLEGIPLAIELAAARALVLAPAQMLHQLSHRFDFLVSRRRDGAKRHQTLHAAVDWSYRLLTPELQQFFARLSVFRGGWTLAAAEMVCQAGGAEGAYDPSGAGARSAGPGFPPATGPRGGSPGLALDCLAQLRECSLVSVEDDRDETRFRMLETLREFGQECLDASGEMAALRRQHAEFFLALAERAGPELHGMEKAIWLERLERDHDNLRAALDWLERGEPDAERRLRLGWALYPFWRDCGHLREGLERLRVLLALPGASVPALARAKALLAAANLAADQGDDAAVRSLSEEGLAVTRAGTRAAGDGDQWRIAGWLSNLGNMDQEQGDFAAARARFEESLAIHRELGDTYHIADLLGRLAGVARSQGDSVTARALLEESLSVHRELTDKNEITELLPSLGFEAWEQGDHAAARALLEAGLAIERESGEKGSIAWLLNHLGHLTLMQGDSAAARALFAESLVIRRELSSKRPIIESLEGLAAAEGRPERAARLLGTAEAVRKAMHWSNIAPWLAEHERTVATARAALGEAAFAAAWAEGRAMTLDQAVADALEQAEQD